MHKPIEDWMLTAHALGELEPEQAAIVDAAIAENPQLQAELESIRATLNTVGLTLQSVAPKVLAVSETAALRDSIATAASSAVSVTASTGAESVQIAKRSMFRRNLWLGLTAVAASGLIAITFGPGLVNRDSQVSMLPASGSTPLSTTAPNSAVANPASSTEAGSIENESVLKQLTDAQDQTVADRLSIVQEEMIAEKKLNEQQQQSAISDDFVVESDRQIEKNASVEGSQTRGLMTAPRGSELAKDWKSESSVALGSDMSERFQAGQETESRVEALNRTDVAKSDSEYSVMPSNSPAELGLEREVEVLGKANESQQQTSAAPSAQAQFFADASPKDWDESEKAQVMSSSSPASGQSVAGMATDADKGLPTIQFGGVMGNVALERKGPALNESVAIEDEQGHLRFTKPRDPQARYYHFYRSDRVLPPDYGIPRDGRLEGDRFAPIEESRFKSTAEEPVTTFSIDVDTASYSKVRQAIMEAGTLPNPNAVRIEELINYFDYNYTGPQDDKPFAAQLAAMDCPWQPRHKLVRVALQAKQVESKARPVSNLVFLLDVSGSMNEPNKLPLVKKSISMLVRQLGENDRVAIVVYAGAAGCVLPSTNGIHQGAIMTALDNLQAGGSTNGAQGIELAYQIAAQNYIKGGVNRIILCTDGDFNVGPSSDEDLIQIVERNARENRVFLTCLGFGMGNYNDSMMEKITNKGNGTYGMIDTELEARKVMVEQINATLMTVAKDVKIQVEFNPNQVAGYRLIGYENRKLANQDFNDDKKDAGEIGAGHSVTALYEIVPVGSEIPSPTPNEDPLRYAPVTAKPEVAETEAPLNVPQVDPALAKELLILKVRYKKPEEDVSAKLEFPMTVDAYGQAIDNDFRWASSIAMFGMKLRNSAYSTGIAWNSLIEQATMSAGEDAYRLEAVDLMRRASGMQQ